MDKEEKIHKKISYLAYNFYIKKGQKHGYDVEDWLNAEGIIRHKSSFFLKKEIWNILGIFISFLMLLITLSPRPSIAISVDNNFSHNNYVSTELKNVGTAPAFDFKYNLFPQSKIDNKWHYEKNPQDPLFGKGILLPGQIYQAGRTISITGFEGLTELMVRYEIFYKFSLFKIPMLDKIKIPVKIDGLLYWQNKKWDTR